MAIILTRKGIEILVDDDLLDKLNRYKWCINSSGYAHTTSVGYMHRFIMNLSLGDKQIVDHIDRNKLDNRKKNLRIVTFAQNTWNLDKRSNNISGLIGVHPNSQSKIKPWCASIKIDGKSNYLGSFTTPEEAHEAYLAAKLKYHTFD